jgi:hypothetical protein
MKSDSHFEIGSTHLVCQDYAISYADDEVAYAIISDGCTSSPNTDIGSRLISIIARDAISYLIHKQRFEKTIDKKLFLNNFVLTFKELVVKKCIEVKGSLNLNVNSFDATLLVALIYPGYQPLLVGWGDGNFIIKYKNGAIRTISMSYDGNMPYYLSYRMSHEKDIAYRQEQKGLGHVTEVLSSGSALSYHHTPWEYNFMRYLDDLKGQDNNSEMVSQIIVSSDGLQSFQYDPKSDEFQVNDKVFTLPEVYPKMIDYKNLVGEFVVRRMKSLEKDNRIKHIIHTDDISCATIVLD